MGQRESALYVIDNRDQYPSTNTSTNSTTQSHFFLKTLLSKNPHYSSSSPHSITQQLGITSKLTDKYQDIPQLTTHLDKSKISELSVEAGSPGFAFWFVVSTYLPIFTACICPLTNMMSIASLVSNWRLDPGSLTDIHSERTDVLVLNAVSLAFGAIGNLSVVLNFSKTMSYKWSQLISIVGFFIAGVLLFTALMIAEVRYFRAPLEVLRSEGFWFAVLTTILYWCCCLTCFVNYLGFLLGKYPPDFNLHTSERGIIVYTGALAILLSSGSAIYSKLLSLRFGECQYFVLITVTTIGYGNIVPKTDAAKAFTMVYALVGVINLGLIVTMISSMIMRESPSSALKWNRVETSRRQTLATIHQNSIDLSAKESFDLMRSLKKRAQLRQQIITSIIALILYLIFWLLGALVFHFSEGWGYGTSCYFVFVSLLAIGYGDYYPSTPSGKAFFVVWVIGAVPLMTCLVSSLGDLIYNQALRSVRIRIVKILFNRTRDSEEEEDDPNKRMEALTEMSLQTLDEQMTEKEDHHSKRKRDLFHNNVKVLKHLRSKTIDSKEHPGKLYTFEEWTTVLDLLELTAEEGQSIGIAHSLFWISDSSPLRFPIKEPDYLSFLLFSKLEDNLQRDMELISEKKLRRSFGRDEAIHRIVSRNLSEIDGV